MGQILKYKEDTISFRRRQKHPLNNLLKELTLETEGAVKTLKELLTSADDKIKLQAASKLLEFTASVSEAINEDDLKRLFMQSKHEAAGGGKGLIPDDDTPLVDFNQIQDV